MKKFFKKKMYIFVLLISLSTLFSAILYAQEMPCQTDEDCPDGYICEDGFCIDNNYWCFAERYNICDISPNSCCYWTIKGSVKDIKCFYKDVVNKQMPQ